MANLFRNKANQLAKITKRKIPAPVGQPCKIDISGYSLDGYKTLNPDGYTLLCRLGEACDGFQYYPKTSKIVLNTNQQSMLVNNFEQFIPRVAEDFGITHEAAVQKSVDFFSQTEVTVRPTGIQGGVYKIMQSAQNFVPMAYTSEALTLLKTSGATGLQIIGQAPLTFVGATYIGAIFFGYCGAIAGENPVGLVLNGTSYVLSRPMRGIEITLNGLILRPASRLVGLPLLLNGTQQVLEGKAPSMQEYTQIGLAFERINNSKIFKKCKKIVKAIIEDAE